MNAFEPMSLFACDPKFPLFRRLAPFPTVRLQNLLLSPKRYLKYLDRRKKKKSKRFQFAEIVCRNQFNLPISSSVQLWATTQNRMTYLSLTEAGTMWSLPDPLIILNSFSFNLSEPTKRKHTNPS